MTSISELKYACVGDAIQVRILRRWKPQYRRHETWFLDVDKFGDAIQILGQRTNQGYIESVLNLSNCYTISEYTCPRLDDYQKVLENDIYMDVGIASVIQPIPDTITIPSAWFRFVSKTQLMEFGENPPFCPDFIGILTKVRDCKKRNGECFVFIVLTDEGELAVNLWKECIDVPEKFNRQQLMPPPATTVVAVTNLRTSSNDGILRFGSSTATHVYVNPPIPEATLLTNRFSGPSRPPFIASGIPTTLSSLVDFAFKDNWCQVICPQCRDPIFEKAKDWFCSAHGLTEAPIFLYRFTATVSDPTGSITSSVSDSAAQRLIGITSEKLMSNNTQINIGNIETLTQQAIPTTPMATIDNKSSEATHNIRTLSLPSQSSNASKALSFETSEKLRSTKHQKRGQQ
ncbi:unnamed protein product [Lactuca virosa]|uniref:Replication factor A C-terminal domain-containing protein n=1 Tax=Lactuca virosa TaxID=75947 RepID=A0AAU9MAU6_9ASTR|nr:unnamed protein product [Lactuca virosa]